MIPLRVDHLPNNQQLTSPATTKNRLKKTDFAAPTHYHLRMFATGMLFDPVCIPPPRNPRPPVPDRPPREKPAKRRAALVRHTRLPLGVSTPALVPLTHFTDTRCHTTTDTIIHAKYETKQHVSLF